MRIVANRAIFLHRRMVVDKGAALFHVTGIASIVDAIPHHFAWTG